MHTHARETKCAQNVLNKLFVMEKFCVPPQRRHILKVRYDHEPLPPYSDGERLLVVVEVSAIVGVNLAAGVWLVEIRIVMLPCGGEQVMSVVQESPCMSCRGMMLISNHRKTLSPRREHLLPKNGIQ